MPPTVRTSSPGSTVSIMRCCSACFCRCGRIRSSHSKANMATIRISDATKSLLVLLGAGGEPRERPGPVRPEVTSLDRLPRARGQPQYEPQIMQAEQPRSEELLLVGEVPDVRTAETRACRAGAVVLEWPRVTREARVAQVEPAGRGEGRPGARRAGRKHAVEHVDAAGDHLEDPFSVP